MPLLPEYNLSGRVAVLATSGGDQAPYLALALSEAGATVFTVARRQDYLDNVLGALEQGSFANWGGVVVDLATRPGLAQAMESFDHHHSPVDILVNDAQEEWDEVQSRNLRGTFLITQAIGRRMVERKYGRIVNLISGLAERGMINASAFAASQAGILSLTRSLAVERGLHNIRVNALGTSWSTAEDIPLEKQREELLVRYTPLRRKGHPRDIGPLLVYLCSEACDYTTGQAVYVDGGLNAHP
ncbi:MAG TPA: SDR family oxidoreductase [Dehalococcoidia bacterium]|nr:SDR family oxidoreductase [Dehalococcoidia bacterium]